MWERPREVLGCVKDNTTLSVVLGLGSPSPGLTLKCPSSYTDGVIREVGAMQAHGNDGALDICTLCQDNDRTDDWEA